MEQNISHKRGPRACAIVLIAAPAGDADQLRRGRRHRHRAAARCAPKRSPLPPMWAHSVTPSSISRPGQRGEQAARRAALPRLHRQPGRHGSQTPLNSPAGAMWSWRWISMATGSPPSRRRLPPGGDGQRRKLRADLGSYSALQELGKLEYVDAARIGMLGHSMGTAGHPGGRLPCVSPSAGRLYRGPD